jgi:sterol desaturase/sphingolipid hydroxylase (fatty acid hydroxylase superfamily)
MNALERFLLTTVGITIETGLRYACFAGAAWVLGYWLFRGKWWHRKIVPRAPLRADIRREIAYSALTLLIFGAVGAATVLARKAGYTQMYFQLGKYGWGWFFASIALTIVLHDTYFYWTHRLMHHPRLFRFFHRGHHLSTNPTPWASYAFDPLEAVVQAGIFPLAVTVMPMHPLAFFVFMLWQITFNVIGHTGYEFYPRWTMDSWLGRILNTPTNHAMHHEYFRGNYGLYFNYWDRLMGTNHERYEERFREVTSRPKPAPEPAVAPAADLTRA